MEDKMKKKKKKPKIDKNQNFPLMFSADLGRRKVGNLSPLIISAAPPK